MNTKNKQIKLVECINNYKQLNTLIDRMNEK